MGLLQTGDEDCRAPSRDGRGRGLEEEVEVGPLLLLDGKDIVRPMSVSFTGRPPIPSTGVQEEERDIHRYNSGKVHRRDGGA